MVRIRLRRVGGKKQPSYRIVAADKESPRDGRFLEILGFYNPRTEPTTLEMKEDRIYDWMSKGAQPSDSVKQLFRSAGLMDRFARYKEGESIEVLLEEAESAAQARVGSPKTTGVAPVKKSVKEEKAAALEAEVLEAVEAEVETEVEEAKAEAVAEVEVEESQAEEEVEIAPAEEDVQVEAGGETDATAEEEVEVVAETEAEEAEAEDEVETETEAEIEVEAETASEDETEEESEAEAEEDNA
jgi:small subunit ribosomal protein S16